MKRMILAVGLAFAAGAAGADPVEGMWQTQEDDGAFAHVKMAPCGAKFCGVIARTFKDGQEYRSENLGKQIVIDMEALGNGAYEGEVWRPANDKVYFGKIQLNGDKMKLSGCVAGGLLCKKQTWTRLK